MRHFVIQGLSPALDGLIVRMDDIVLDEPESLYVPVDLIVNENIMFGDRNLKFPITTGGLLILRTHLVELDNSIADRQFDNKNPYGKFVKESRCVASGGSLEIVYSLYENVLQVSVLEKSDGRAHTRYSQNFLSGFDSVMSEIDSVFKQDGIDADNLIFRLREIKQAELAAGENRDG